MSHAPKHVAIIMDGNGRWATNQNKSRKVGHYYGSENVREIALSCLEKGVKVMTLYTFSTENWKRPQAEIDYLMKLVFLIVLVKSWKMPLSVPKTMIN